MRKFLIGAMVCILATWALAMAASPDRIVSDGAPPSAPDEERDIIWAGGDDGNGIAYEGGIWDWDTIVSNPLQGWHSVDKTCDQDVYFGYVTDADFIAHGDPCNPMFPDTPGMLWCGIHEDEAVCRGFPGGMGYQNKMCQSALSPELAIDPATEDLTVEFEYFLDMEDGFDFTYVYVLCYDAVGDLLEEREIGTLTGIVGSPAAPEDFAATLPAGDLNPLTVTLKVELRVDSDGGWSDQDGMYDSTCGPFAADNVGVHIGAAAYLYRFNTGPDDWTFEACPGVGTFMAVVPEETWTAWLIAAGISSWPMSGNAVTFTDLRPGGYPSHPAGHDELGISGPVPRFGGSFPDDTTLVRWDQYNLSAAYTWRLGYMYYPYIVPGCPEAQWSPRLGQDVIFFATTGCASYEVNLTTLDGMGGQPLPADWDSLRFVFEVSSYDPCFSSGAPTIDNVQVGILHTASAAEEEIGRMDGNHLYASRWDPRQGGARVRFHLGEVTHVNLSLFDATGRKVATLLDGTRTMGEHFFNWDGAGQPGGIYYLRMQTASGFEASTRLLITK